MSQLPPGDLPRPAGPFAPADARAVVSAWLARARAASPAAGSGPAALAAGAVVGALVAMVGLLVLRADEPGPAESLPRAVRVTTTTAPAGPVLVHVAGAVNAPGLVPVPDGARVAEAIDAAGGPRPDADLARLNLAEKLGDGARLYVPAAGEQPPVALSPTGGGSTTGAGPSGAGAPVDLNTATAEQLDTLPGIGPATAAAIIAHRNTHGPFRSVDDLLAVRGIGPAKLEALREQVRV